MALSRMTVAWALAFLSCACSNALRNDGHTTRPRFRVEPVADTSLRLSDNGRPVLVFNHGEISSDQAPKAAPRSNYLHPIYGLDGEVLTDDFPADHVNHRGLYWAWPHVTVGATEYDLWGMRGIRYRVGEPDVLLSNVALLVFENGWHVGDKQVMREELRLRVYPATTDSRAIDVELTWAPTDQPVTLRGAEGKGYGGLALRYGPRASTVITTPNGRAGEDLVTARLPWADFAGDINGHAPFGAAIFAHPSNPDGSPEWMARHYGMLAAGWPGVKPRTLVPGESVTHRYRLWIHRDNPEAAEIQKAYDAYVAGD